MRLLWETEGSYQSHPEHDFFLAVGWLDDISTERLDSQRAW
jgi:hypothetical protein